MTTATLDVFNQITLLNLLDERAVLLDASFVDGRYEESFEHKLARELIAGLSTGQQHDALEWLVADKMRSEIAMDGLLDECESASYEVAETVARIVLAEIAIQDREAVALEVLARDEICQRQELIAFARKEQQA